MNAPNILRDTGCAAADTSLRIDATSPGSELVGVQPYTMHHMEHASGIAALSSTCAVLRSFSSRWWIAGGWALDLHIGGEHRSHQDVDVAVLRADQHELQRHLADWSLYKVVSGIRLPWKAGESLLAPVHQIHAERHGEQLELLLNESAADRWLFRRNRMISLPLSQLSRCSSGEIPYLCPQVVLLFKAKNPRAIDQTDFERALPTLNGPEKQWLSHALDICQPGHEWLHRLAS